MTGDPDSSAHSFLAWSIRSRSPRCPMDSCEANRRSRWRRDGRFAAKRPNQVLALSALFDAHPFRAAAQPAVAFRPCDEPPVGLFEGSLSYGIVINRDRYDALLSGNREL